MKTTDIVADSVDSLVLKGFDHIKKTGEEVSARGLSGLQSYNVNYILTDVRNRVHTIRTPLSVEYLAKELLVFFSGSLKATDFAHASKSWLKWADKEGNIFSNYGYHVFHQKTPEGNTQYEWVVDMLSKERLARRAVININQVSHKVSSMGDIPCVLTAHFFVQDNRLCSAVSARATDVITGLCNNMGFFSLVTELVWKDLVERGDKDLKLGYCMMKTNLTQLYDNHLDRIKVLEENRDKPIDISKQLMPEITSAKDLLKDIKEGTRNSSVTQWCVENSDLS